MHDHSHDALASAFPTMEEAQARQFLTTTRGYLARATLGGVHPKTRDALLGVILADALATRARFDPTRTPKHLPSGQHSPRRALLSWLVGIGRRIVREMQP